MDGLGIVFVGVGMIYMEFIYTEDESKLQMFIYKIYVCGMELDGVNTWICEGYG